MPAPAKVPSDPVRTQLRLWQSTAVIVTAAWIVPAPHGRWITAGGLILCALSLLATVVLRGGSAHAEAPGREQPAEAPRVEPQRPETRRSTTAGETDGEPSPAPASPSSWKARTGDQKVFHVIATRHGIGVFDEHWFAYRQHMMENITIPSLDAQTRQDFVWLVGIDRDMPERARKRLDELAAARPYIRLLELELKSDFRGAVAKWAAKRAPRRNADWVMTTRLDDDDAIAMGMVERLHAEAQDFLRQGERRPALFAPVLGCNWVPTKMAGHRAFRAGPSIGMSLLLPADDRRTVYHWNHMKINRELAAAGAYVKSIDDDTLWWLYANTSVSDQQGPEIDRRARAYGHPNAFAIDEAFLKRFGISPHSAALLRSVPEPEPIDTTYYLTSRGEDVERDIRGLRNALRKGEHVDESEAERIAARIAELHGVRRSMHEHLVKPADERLSEVTDSPPVR